MNWPTEHHCHEDDWQFQRFQNEMTLGTFRVSPFIRQPLGVEKDYAGKGREFNSDPLLTPYRTCDYCGSIHPEDLYNALMSGATAHSADWKYGYPHKLYLDGIPNPHAGVVTVYGTSSGGGRPTEYITGPESATLSSIKFYTVHLRDLEPEPFEALSTVIEQHTGIAFVLQEVDGKKRLRYRGTPHPISLQRFLEELRGSNS